MKVTIEDCSIFSCLFLNLFYQQENSDLQGNIQHNLQLSKHFCSEAMYTEPASFPIYKGIIPGSRAINTFVLSHHIKQMKKYHLTYL